MEQKNPNRSTSITSLQTNKIKKVMQDNREIGKIQKKTPLLIGMAIEAFLETLAAESTQLCKETNTTKITPSHIKQVIMNKQNVSFLRQYVKSVPDLEIKKKPTLSSSEGTPIRRIKNVNRKK